ncbi:MAG: FAD-dependent oxidoreductase, partial [Phycisphaerae bacterium]|nr:FAD-dependent oxidoreductase [Phycisphaerae bacterium]
MRTQQLSADFCVAGGGMAGVCAAIAAARAGLKVVLVQDRPVLGGNASSEIRVWIQGATASGGNRFAREGGILNEILLEHLYRNPENNPHLFDALLLDFV